MVQYPQEIKASLLQVYSYRIELHAHTGPVSACSGISAKEMVQRYAKKGFHGVVLTNHVNPEIFRYTPEEWTTYYLKDYEEALEEGNKCGVKVMLGMEIRFTENNNDYLIYGVDRDFVLDSYSFVKKGIKAFYQAFQWEHRVILQAHPCRNGMEHINPNFLDGFEVFNLHSNHNARIGLAARRAQEKKGIVIGGSDFHNEAEEGMLAVCTKEMPKDSFALADLLKKGDYVLEVGDSVILP